MQSREQVTDGPFVARLPELDPFLGAEATRSLALTACLSLSVRFNPPQLHLAHATMANPDGEQNIRLRYVNTGGRRRGVGGGNWQELQWMDQMTSRI